MADNAYANRRSIRLPGFDYSSQGAYFVTIVANNRRCAFGEIVGEHLKTTKLGRMVEEEWLVTAQVRPGVELEAFVLMPNHMHGILCLPSPRSTDGSGSLATTVRGFKAAVTRRYRREASEPDAVVWQRNYYDIIRDDDDWNAIHAYIEDNPRHWAQDSENPQHTRP